MLPDHEKTRLPEGEYQFQIISEPEKRRHTGKGGKEFISIKFDLKATDEIGQVFEISESFLAFEDKYADLLIALGAKEKDGRLSGSTIEPIGMMFRGKIVHIKDEKDPSKTWARIVNIKSVEPEAQEEENPDEPLPVKSPAEEDDSIPF